MKVTFLDVSPLSVSKQIVYFSYRKKSVELYWGGGGFLSPLIRNISEVVL